MLERNAGSGGQGGGMETWWAARGKKREKRERMTDGKWEKIKVEWRVGRWRDV